MAIYLSYGGNNSIVFGGQWNSPYPNTIGWANPLIGATALTIAITVKPEFTTYPEIRHIFHNEDGFDTESTFSLRLNTDRSYEWWVINGSGAGLKRKVKTPASGPFSGVWQRIMCRWRASDQLMSIWVNGVALTPTVVQADILPSLSAIFPVAPFELGANSYDDTLPLQGDYAEAAIWSAYLPDTDAVKYGQGYSPNLLTSTGRARYLRLTDIGAITPGVWQGAPMGQVFGTCVDEWNQKTYAPNDPEPTGGVYAGHAEGGIDTSYTRTHPAVFYADPGTESAYLPHLIEDIPSLPHRGFELYELKGYPGKRSGTTHQVPSATDLQTAIANAQYGDDIVIAAGTVQAGTFQPANKTYTDATPRMPPMSQSGPAGSYLTATPLTSSTAPTSSAAPACHGCEPAYIRIRTSNLAGLPVITSRRIPLPDGTTVTRLGGIASRANHTHWPAMATIRGGPCLLTGQGYGLVTRGYYFDGIRFQFPLGVDYNAALIDLTPNAGSSEGYPANTFHQGQNPGCQRRFLFNRSSFEGDPAGDSHSGNKCLTGDGEYLGIVNSRIIDLYQVGGGNETKRFEMLGAGWGPWHFENTEVQTDTASLFTGGGGHNGVPCVVQDIVYRGIWQHTPRHWQLSEINGQGYSHWRVNIAPAPNDDRLTLDQTYQNQFQEGWDYNAIGFGPGCIAYEMTTGKARVIADLEGPGGLRSTFTVARLTQPWGTAVPINALQIRLQGYSPDLVAYNSGLDTPMPMATTVAGSATVTFTNPIPATVLAGVHYFYLNNTYWAGGSDGNFPPFSQQPVAALNNGFGYQYGASGISLAQRKRKKILTIAADRLSCVLSDDGVVPAPGGYWESNTFPYSCVVGDGLWRCTAQKGRWETKIGNRILMEGCVLDDAFAITNHPTNQLISYFGDIEGVLGNFTVVGDQATLVSGLAFPAWWVPNFFVGRRRFPKLGPYMMLFANSDVGSPAREILSVAPDRLSAVLAPIKAGFTRQLGDVTNAPMGVAPIDSPWTENSHHVHRYNIIPKASGTAYVSSYSGIVNATEHVKGHNFLHHDLLFIRPGAPTRYNAGRGWDSNLMSIGGQPTAGNLVDGSSQTDTPITNDNGTIRMSHVTVAHIVGGSPPSNIPMFFINRNAGTVNVKARTIEIADNLFLGVDTARGVFSDSPSNVWDLASGTIVHRRNVLAGVYGPGMAAGNGVTFPDNTGVTSVDQVGCANYNGANLLDPLNYVLTDIYNTGTISIAADGMSATLTSGTFPANVVEGQFFRTETSAELRKITAVQVGTIRWTTAAHPEAGQAGKVFRIGFRGTGTDGKDPGADMALIKAFTDDIVDPQYA